MASGIWWFSSFELSGLMAWGFDDFVEVKNENFKIYDFIFELNFLGFFVFVSQENFWGWTQGTWTCSSEKNNERNKIF